MPAELIGKIAGILALISLVPYIVDIFRGNTKPERTTWAIWSVVSTILFFSYYASGARETIWVGLMWMLGTVIVFLLSIKYGVGGTSKLDIACLIGALFGLLLWFITKDPTKALYINLAMDFL